MPKILDAPKPQNFAARRKKGMVIQMDYTTQMDAARKGILTGQLRAVAVEEKMEAERLRELVEIGRASCRERV